MTLALRFSISVVACLWLVALTLLGTNLVIRFGPHEVRFVQPPSPTALAPTPLPAVAEAVPVVDVSRETRAPKEKPRQSRRTAGSNVSQVTRTPNAAPPVEQTTSRRAAPAEEPEEESHVEVVPTVTTDPQPVDAEPIDDLEPEVKEPTYVTIETPEGSER